MPTGSSIGDKIRYASKLYSCTSFFSLPSHRETVHVIGDKIHGHHTEHDHSHKEERSADSAAGRVGYGGGTTAHAGVRRDVFGDEDTGPKDETIGFSNQPKDETIGSDNFPKDATIGSDNVPKDDTLQSEAIRPGAAREQPGGRTDDLWE